MPCGVGQSCLPQLSRGTGTPPIRPCCGAPEGCADSDGVAPAGGQDCLPAERRICGDGATGAAAPQHETLYHCAPAPCHIAVSPDGSLCAVSHWQRFITIWETHPGTVLLRIDMQAGDIPHDSCGVRGATFTPCSRRLVSWAGSFIHIWDARSGACVRALEAGSFSTAAVKCSPCGRWLVGFAAYSMTGVWDAGGAAHPAYRLGLSATAGHVTRGAILYAGEDMVVRAAPLPGESPRHCPRLRLAHSRRVCDIVSAAAETLLVTCTGRHTVCLWAFPSGALLRRLRGHAGGLKRLAAATHSTLFATCDKEQAVRIYSPSGECLRVVRGCGSDMARGLALSPCGSWVFSADGAHIRVTRVVP